MQKAVKQTLLGTIFSYLGIALGAFYMIFIIPRLFHSQPENYGALTFLTNYAGLFLILASFATPLSILKFYPLYQKKEREEMLSFLFSLNGIGLAISFLIFFFDTQNSPIFIVVEGTKTNISYFFYPLLVSMTLFSFFESYCHALLKIAVPAFLNNAFTRLWMFGTLLLFYYNLIDFKVFCLLYFGQFFASFTLLILFVWRIKKDNFKLRFAIPKNAKNIISYSLFALPATSAAILIAKIDIHMIGRILGEAEVAFYNYAIYFMSVLLIPKNTLMQTCRSIISKDFQTQSIEKLRPKYLKMSFAFLLATLVVFIAIAINIDDLMLLLGNKFGSHQVKYAILILGAGRVLESAFVSNHAILEYSKYYKMIVVFELTSLALLILLNFLLIPYLGILGAAISSALMFVINALIKSLFIYKKLGLHPLKKQHLGVFLSICTLSLLYFLPTDILSLFNSNILNSFFSIVIRSVLLLGGLIFISLQFNLKDIYSNFTK